MQIYIDRCKEMLRTDKEHTLTWVKRMHATLQCYKEYLLTLNQFEKYTSNDASENIEPINGNLNDESKELIKSIQSM